MPVRHCVTLEFNETATPEQVQALIDALKELPSRVRSMWVVCNIAFSRMLLQVRKVCSPIHAPLYSPILNDLEAAVAWTIDRNHIVR